MEQFTASEVVTKLRERFASGNDVPVPDVRLTRAEFDVIADLLEAQEKAAPVAWRREHLSPTGERIGWILTVGDPIFGHKEPLYTHPAPADVERLAEALRWYQAQVADCRKITQEGNNARHALDADGGKRAARALAAHSAQAQPPAVSVPGELAEPSKGILNYEQELSFAEGWNACRAAMLAAQENPNG